jgi:PST family polysaccharide transporter
MEKSNITLSLKSILVNFSHLAFGEFTSRAFGFFTTVYLARELGIIQFGLYSWIMSIYSLAFLFANFGFETYGTLQFSKTKDARTISAITFLRLILSLFVIGLVMVIASNLFTDIYYIVLIFLTNILLVPLYFQFVFRATNNVSLIAISRIIQSVSFFLLVILFISDSSIYFVALFLYVSILLSHLPLLLKVNNLYPSAFSLPTYASLKSTLIGVLPVGISGALILIYLNMGMFLLGLNVPPHEIAQFSVAYRIYLLGFGLLELLYLTILPIVSVQYGTNAFRETILKYFILLVIIGGICISLGVFLGTEIIVVLYGEGFRDGGLILKILMLSLGISGVSMNLMNLFQISNQNTPYIFILTFRTVIFIVICFLGIKYFGIYGAAVAILITEVLVTFVVSFIVRQRIRF